MDLYYFGPPTLLFLQSLFDEDKDKVGHFDAIVS